MTPETEFGWKYALVGEAEAHIFPVGDRVHEMHSKCWCSPQARLEDGVEVFSHSWGQVQ